MVDLSLLLSPGCSSLSHSLSLSSSSACKCSHTQLSVWFSSGASPPIGCSQSSPTAGSESPPVHNSEVTEGQHAGSRPASCYTHTDQHRWVGQVTWNSSWSFLWPSLASCPGRATHTLWGWRKEIILKSLFFHQILLNSLNSFLIPNISRNRNFVTYILISWWCHQQPTRTGNKIKSYFLSATKVCIDFSSMKIKMCHQQRSRFQFTAYVGQKKISWLLQL